MNRQLMALALSACCVGGSAAAADFDFALGTWYAQLNRLSPALGGGGTWSKSQAVQTTVPWLGAVGNVDEVRVDGKLLGSTIRLRDRTHQRWADYWVATSDGVLQPPLFGQFAGHAGTFLGDDTLGGQPIRVRYTWSALDSPHPRWVQAFSADGGKTWADNWTADYSRVPAGVVPAPIVEWRGSRDFDFVLGTWQVRSRRLKQILSGSQEWTEGTAVQTAIPMLDGLGNRDEFLVDGQPAGGSLRLYNPRSQQWSIYWVGTRDGILQPPVHGRFVDGTGVFEGDDTWNGKPVKVRYTWSNTHTATPRWEQAFSADGGRTWEANWVMDFRRGP